MDWRFVMAEPSRAPPSSDARTIPLGGSAKVRILGHGRRWGVSGGRTPASAMDSRQGGFSRVAEILPGSGRRGTVSPQVAGRRGGTSLADWHLGRTPMTRYAPYSQRG